jgi:hypothetical protein
MKINIAVIGTYQAFMHHIGRFQGRITFARLSRAYYEVGEFCFHHVGRPEQVRGLHIQSYMTVGVDFDEAMMEALDYAKAAMRPLPPKIVPPFCSQCGKTVEAWSCGPTHALLKAEWQAR